MFVPPASGSTGISRHTACSCPGPVPWKASCGSKSLSLGCGAPSMPQWEQGVLLSSVPQFHPCPAGWTWNNGVPPLPGLGARRGHCLQCFISTFRPSPGQDKRILSHVPEGQTNGTQQSLALLFSNSSSLRNLPKSQSDTKPVQRVTECSELEGSTRTIESNSCPTGQSQESHHAVRRPEVFVGFQDLTGKSCR